MVPIRLGPVTVDGHLVVRSGLRWLCEDGHDCRPGEIVAYCNISVLKAGRQVFAEEFRDMQAALATRVGGRLRISPTSSQGGFVDRLQGGYDWQPDFVAGHIETESGDAPLLDGPEDQGRLFVMAGRRMSELAEDRSSLLTGWHERRRAWSGEGDGLPTTLLGVGICEQAGVLGGERGAFLELFEQIAGPAQIVIWDGEPLIPCARIVVEQIERTPAAFEAIAEDMARTFLAGGSPPNGAEWLFMGALLSALQRNPVAESYDIVTRTGLQRLGQSEAVMLSLNAEQPMLARHKRLNYSFHAHSFRLHDAGPRVRAWLAANFDYVRHTPADSLADLTALIDSIRTAPGGEQRVVLVMNGMSSSGAEDIQTYAAFDAPLGGTLESVRNKDMNLMLHDLAAARDISIVDNDAIAAEIGGAFNLPDGVHQSGLMQRETRAEVLRILRARALAGFAAL